MRFTIYATIREADVSLWETNLWRAWETHLRFTRWLAIGYRLSAIAL